MRTEVVKVGLLIFAMIGVGMGAFMLSSRSHSSVSDVAVKQPDTTELFQPPVPCVPTFLDGGGPYYLVNAPFRENIAPDSTDGQTLVVRGRIWNENCSDVLSGLILDVWQASEEGEYDQEWYRGRVYSKEDGSFQFTTVIPEGYGEGTGYRPPHIHFKIWNGEQLLVTSQMFFPEVQGRPGFEDAYIVDIWQTDTGWEAWHDIVI